MQKVLEQREPTLSFPGSELLSPKPVKRRRLAIIDLDDTLLGPGKKVSIANSEALRSLRAAGFETIVASGRHHQNILRYEDAIGSMNWIISSGGAVVRHAKTNEVLQELTVPESDALAIYAAAEDVGLSVVVYHRDGVFMEKSSEWTRLYARVAGWTPKIGNLPELAATGVQKVLLLHSGTKMASVRAEFTRRFGGDLYVVETQEEILEFLSPHANKALAAQALARRLNVEQADIVAFGDGNNDVELLWWSGFSVAMAHGRVRAHRAANRISPAGPADTAFSRAVDLVLENQEAVL